VVAAHVAFAAIAAGTAMALFQLFGRDSWAAGATGLFFVASTTFLDWQLCPQTIAFLLLVVLLSTTRSRRLPAVVGSVALFTVLSLTHPFAAFWLIGAIILARVTAFLGSHSGRFDVGGWSISPALLIAIELSVVAYIAVSLVRSLADALGAIGHALESGGSISAAAAVASIGSGDGPLMYKLVVWTGVLGVLGAGLTLLAGSLARFVAGRTRPIEVGLGVLGLGQFVIGLVVPVFGGRGVQIFLLGLSAGMRDLAGTGRRARVVVALVCLVLLCAPAIVATSVRNTLFMTASEEAAAVYVAQRVVTTDQVVFAAGLAGGYVRNFATIRLEALNPRSAGRADILGPGDLPAVVIWGPELEIELARVRDLTATDAAAYPTFVAQHYRLLATFEDEQVWAR
jgi:hypothetical protein